MKDRSKLNECYRCKHRGEVNYSAHSFCKKPDSGMTGEKHGIEKGWFNYPINFDPCWKALMCNNFEEKQNIQSC